MRTPGSCKLNRDHFSACLKMKQISLCVDEECFPLIVLRLSPPCRPLHFQPVPCGPGKEQKSQSEVHKLHFCVSVSR
jgi:hypothetical protein